MAEALDLNLAIYAAMYDALEADAVWGGIVPVGNRIRTDKPEDERHPKKSLADGDAASSKLRLRSGATGLKTDNMTFGTMDGSDEDTLERMSFIYRMRLTSQLLSDFETSNLTTETVRVIRSLGPRLGLAYVTGVKLRWETNEVTSEAGGEDDTDANIRLVTNLDIMVDVEVDPNDLD